MSHFCIGNAKIPVKTGQCVLVINIEFPTMDYVYVETHDALECARATIVKYLDSPRLRRARIFRADNDIRPLLDVVRVS